MTMTTETSCCQSIKDNNFYHITFCSISLRFILQPFRSPRGTNFTIALEASKMIYYCGHLPCVFTALVTVSKMYSICAKRQSEDVSSQQRGNVYKMD